MYRDRPDLARSGERLPCVVIAYLLQPSDSRRSAASRQSFNRTSSRHAPVTDLLPTSAIAFFRAAFSSRSWDFALRRSVNNVLVATGSLFLARSLSRDYRHRRWT